MRRLFGVMIVGLLLAGCGAIPSTTHISLPTQANFQDNPPVITPVGAKTPISSSAPTPLNYKDNYDNMNLRFIHFRGVDETKIMRIIYTINPKYFQDLISIDFVKTKFSDLQQAGTYNENAEYTPTANGGIIKVYLENEDNVLTIHNLLHELKHHYCWTNGYKWTTIAESHQGCFLNTPIDKEYGFIK